MSPILLRRYSTQFTKWRVGYIYTLGSYAVKKIEVAKEDPFLLGYFTMTKNSPYEKNIATGTFTHTI